MKRDFPSCEVFFFRFHLNELNECASQFIRLYMKCGLIKGQNYPKTWK